MRNSTRPFTNTTRHLHQQFDILLLAVLEGTYRKIPSQREVWVLLGPGLTSYSIMTSTKIPVTVSISSYAISQIHSLEDSKPISHKLSKERQNTFSSKVRKQLLQLIGSSSSCLQSLHKNLPDQND